jgi:hypothetical protein
MQFADGFFQVIFVYIVDNLEFSKDCSPEINSLNLSHLPCVEVSNGIVRVAKRLGHSLFFILTGL